MTTAWAVPRDWEGECVAVLASGPSMSREVAEEVRGRCRVIAVSNQGIDTTVNGVTYPAPAPWADMLYAADVKWWQHYRDAALRFAGDKVTVRSLLPFHNVLSLQLSLQLPFDPRPTHVVAGGNSGYQALHIAVQRGARRVLLCGFDMRDVGGRKHWFGDHEGRLNTVNKYDRWLRNFDALAPVLKARGVEVLNCTPNSALRSFPRVSLQEALNA